MTKLTESLNSLIDKYVEWSMTGFGKRILFFSLIAISLLSGWSATHLSFDFEFEKFFPKNHPESIAYQKHVAQFGYDNDFLQIILEHESGVFDTAFMQRAMAFEATLEELTDVVRVYSPLSLRHIIKSPTGVIAIPLIHQENALKLKKDSIRIFGNPLYSAAFGEDGKSLSIYLQHAHFNDPARGEIILEEIYKNASENGIEQIRLVGKLSASKVFINHIRGDFGVFLLGGLIISYLALLLIFKNHKVALLPFLISLLTMVWTFGLMSLLGVEISLLSSLLPPILFFVSMSDAIHLMNAMNKNQSSDKIAQAKSSLRTVFVPTLLTSLTTAVGFLSLLWINTIPVQNLGTFAAVGILFAFMITFSLGLLIIPYVTSPPQKLNMLPDHFTHTILTNQRWIMGVFGVIVICAIPGVFKMEIDAYLLDDLPPENEIRQDFEYADRYLGGSKPYEVRVEVIDSSHTIWDKEVMDELVKIENYLLHAYPISKVQSPATIIKYLHMASNGGLNSNYTYPNDDEAFEKVIDLKNRIDPKRMNKLVTDDAMTARLIGFFPEMGSRETGRRNKAMLAYLNENIDQSLISYQVTGTTYLIDKSHEFLSKNLLFGILTAIGIISIVLSVYFKSVKLVLLSLIPNLIPLLLIAGMIGWSGIPLQMTTAIIFTIVFGIAVDDTIHMISHYLRNKGTHKKRLTLTFEHAGSALVITTLVVSVGFSLFLFSNFGATFYLGLFITLSLLVALIVDLTLLPILLKWIED